MRKPKSEKLGHPPSLTSIVFHGIPAHTPALASLAPECKGCLGTVCKGVMGLNKNRARVGHPLSGSLMQEPKPKRERLGTRQKPKREMGGLPVPVSFLNGQSEHVDAYNDDGNP